MNWRYIFLGLLVLLLFVGGPDSTSHRVYQEVWDTGHMVLFAGLIWVLLFLPVFKSRRWVELFLMVSGFCLIVGFAIEVLQLFVGRNFAMKDLVNDVLGGYLGLLIVTAQQSHRPIVIRVAMYPLMLGIIVWVLLPTTYAIMDEYVMEDEFPILADFETPYQLSRWDNNLATLSIVDKYFRYGNKSMRVDFDAGEYPDITLKDFPRNWGQFTSIKFSIFNTMEENIPMELKIYDWQHDHNGYEYSDRFNRELVLKPGWNDFLISLEEVRAAPEDRKMDLSDISSFSLFLHDLEQPITLYFDNLRLSSSQ
jgi:VanZ family protein